MRELIVPDISIPRLLYGLFMLLVRLIRSLLGLGEEGVYTYT